MACREVVAVQPSVVGRDEELASLERILTAPLPWTLLLEGEAGIGKTTLWEQAVASARRSGFRVIACRPSGAETQLAYAALGDLLQPVLSEVLPHLARPQAQALQAALLLEDPEDAELKRRGVAVAFLGSVLQLERKGPLGLAVDDLHWLDRETARVLEFAARRLEGRRVALLLARRADPDDRLRWISSAHSRPIGWSGCMWGRSASALCTICFRCASDSSCRGRSSAGCTSSQEVTRSTRSSSGARSSGER